MAKLFVYFFGLLLFSASGLNAQFEGAIEMQVTLNENNVSHTATYQLYVKKNQLATEVKGDSVTGGSGRFIFRGDKKLLWIIDNGEKKYTEISLKESGKKTSAKHLPAESKITKTGKTETILGYPCDEYFVTDANEETRFWATSKLGNVYEGLMKSFGEMGGSEMNSGDWESELAGMKIFPLKLATIRNGQVTESQEVTRIQAKKLPATIFAAPSGYKKETIQFDMQKLMEQMQQDMNKLNPNDSSNANGD